MDWRIKAGIQKVLSYTRIGDKLNHIPVLLNSNYHKNVVRYQLYESLRKFSYTNLDLNLHRNALELGTGYSLISAVVLHLVGFKNIVTVDISKDVNFKTLKVQLYILNNEEHIREIAKRSIFSAKELNGKLSVILLASNLDQLLSICNIIYIAPYSFNEISHVSQQFDYICSQVVFEHIAPEFLEKLIKQIKIWLKRGAYTVHTINFVDHFTNPGIFQDKRISAYNFLKYSNAYWKFWAGNDIAYTNRLSYMFYEDIFKDNCLEIIEFIGENYKKSIPLPLDAVHSDVIKKYKTDIALKNLTKYQRGTYIVKKGC